MNEMKTIGYAEYHGDQYHAVASPDGGHSTFWVRCPNCPKPLTDMEAR